MVVLRIRCERQSTLVAFKGKSVDGSSIGDASCDNIGALFRREFSFRLFSRNAIEATGLTTRDEFLPAHPLPWRLVPRRHGGQSLWRLVRRGWC